MIPKPACDHTDYYVLANLMKAGFIAIALLPDATTGKRIEELRSEMELAIWLFMTNEKADGTLYLGRSVYGADLMAKLRR